MSRFNNVVDLSYYGFRIPHSCVGDSMYFVKIIVKYYALLGTVNLMIVAAKPILAGEGVTPFPSLPRFDFEEYPIGFYALYANQALNVLFAGGINLVVNILIFTLLICIHFTITLLACRLRRFGNDSHRRSARKPAEDYQRIIDLIRCHIEIEQSVSL